jgi:hypothetical protein
MDGSTEAVPGVSASPYRFLCRIHRIGVVRCEGRYEAFSRLSMGELLVHHNIVAVSFRVS